MKNRIIFSILLAFACITLGAQVHFGLRGGINSTKVNLGSQNYGNYRLEYERNGLGFHLGGLVQVKLLSFVIQPELLYSRTRADVQLTIIDPVTLSRTNEFGEQFFNRIDIPVIAGYILGPVKFQAGPVATIALGSKSDLFNEFNINQEFSGATIGYQAGVGIQLANLMLDFKYEGNLSRMGNGVTIGGNDFRFDQRQNQFILSVGFLFGND